MIGIYLLSRLFLWILAASLLLFCLMVYLAWQPVAMVIYMTRQRSQLDTPRPRNERMYYSNRR